MAYTGCLSLFRGIATRWALLASRPYSTTPEKPIGFIGVGNMGGPMAANLLSRGKKVIVFDVVASSVDQLVGAGAVKAGSPAEVARQTNLIVTMLPSHVQVLEVYEGKGGIFSTISKGTLLVDSSTIDPSVAKDMSAKSIKFGASYVDAPVSGGVGAAKRGALTFMVGGAVDSFERARPVLECMGKNIVHCGDSGAGQATKICNNMMLAIEMIGTSEALQLGRSLGLDPKLLTKVINMASGRCWSSEVYNPCPGVMENVPSNNNYEGGFGTALMTKDLGLAMQAASSTRSATPLGALSHQIYTLMCRKGWGHKDFSVVFKLLEKEGL
ncbi:hypothetical protein EMCRGX_G004075 [Ephydatia muelleri]